MTSLDRLIKARVEQTTLTTMSQATERLAEEMAREMLRDPAVRAELQHLVRTHFGGTIAALRRPLRKKARA